jgi:addiction module RelB/DinJ family antitoxin
MAKTAVVRARTEPELKEHAEKILEGLGIKPSEAINMFYHQIERTGGLPFEINSNQVTQELNEDMRRLRECRDGYFIEHDTVDTWLQTIGTDDEMPCPIK